VKTIGLLCNFALGINGLLERGKKEKERRRRIVNCLHLGKGERGGGCTLCPSILRIGIGRVKVPGGEKEKKEGEGVHRDSPYTEEKRKKGEKRRGLGFQYSISSGQRRFGRGGDHSGERKREKGGGGQCLYSSIGEKKKGGGRTALTVRHRRKSRIPVGGGEGLSIRSLLKRREGREKKVSSKTSITKYPGKRSKARKKVSAERGGEGRRESFQILIYNL